MLLLCGCKLTSNQRTLWLAVPWPAGGAGITLVKPILLESRRLTWEVLCLIRCHVRREPAQAYCCEVFPDTVCGSQQLA